MEAARSIEEMSGSELLDHVDDLATAQRRCELQILRAAVQHAVINNPDTLDPQLAQLPGRERARRFGGVGTEAVAEFASAELGARLGVSSWSAHSLMADALDLVIRLPLIWARVEALEVEASYARYVARRTRDLAIEQAGQVDERVVESADGRIPWSRFEELVAGQDMDWSKLLPAVTILVHMYLGTAEAPSEGVARVEGVGPVTDAFVARHLARAATVTVQPVLDLAGQAPVDSYEIPDVHRWAVHVMCPADVFPFAPNTSRDKQIDHTVPYQHSPPGCRSVTDRELRSDDLLPPQGQDARQLAGPAALPGHLHLARSLRRVLPGRPHRHPATPDRCLTLGSHERTPTRTDRPGPDHTLARHSDRQYLQ